MAAALAAVTMLLAGGASANPHYDANATTGGLQKVCTDFSIDSTDLLEAKCNKSTAGVITKVDASLDLTSDTDSGCQGRYVSVTPYADRVEYKFKCVGYNHQGTEMTSEHTKDLNDKVKWDASAGKLLLKRAASS